MIICITDLYKKRDKYGLPTGENVRLVSYAINAETGAAVIVPNIEPEKLGAIYDENICEWVIND